MTEMSVRQWQERFRAGDFSSKDRAVQCEAGWYDWFCQDVALAGRLQKLSKVVMGITDPYILDHYYVWFKNNCPLSGPLYDDIRFEPLHGDCSGKYFVVIRDSPHEAHKWTLYTERHGFEQPEFTCGNVRDMLRHINSMAPEDIQMLAEERDLKMPEALSSLRLPAWLKPDDLRIFCLRTFQDCLRMTRAGRFLPSSPRLMTWGTAWNGWCLTARISVSPRSESGCSLSDILIPDAPEKYFLSSEQTEKLLYKSSAGRRDRESMTPEGPPVHRLPEVEEKE